MHRFVAALAAWALLIIPGVSPAQVVETTPDPPRTDKSVTVFFNAGEGTGGLAGHDGQVFAHTGLSTDENPEKAWKCVKNDWPTADSFGGNRDDTEMTQVAPNRYRLEIDDIRAYYQNTSTSCDLAADEEIQTMNFVFRNADGSKEGKAEGGEDIFVEVADVAGGGAFVGASITAPDADPPLFPFIASTDTTVTVSIEADTANVESLDALRLVVDGGEVASSSEDVLDQPLTLDTPNRFQVQAIAEATANGVSIKDTSETFFIRTPEVVDEARPAGVEDGINKQSETTVTFSLNAPNKDFVYLLGDFNDWTIDSDYFLKRDGDRWWITVDGLQGGREYAFQYFVDGELRIGDPFAKKVLTPSDGGISDATFPDLKPYPDSLTESIVSVVETGREDFNFSSFTPPPQDEMVVYELLVRDFLEQGNYQTLIDTLDYLDRLGVNAIELMPVSEFGGNNSWGYNPSFHLAFDKSYGPRKELKKFVEEAHQRGIAVILDVVYNHITGQSPLVRLYGTDASKNPFLEDPQDCGPFNELNQKTSFIRNYINRANTYWLEEFNVDGFRFDLASCLDVNTASGEVDGVKRISDHVWDNVDPDTYMIMEFFGGFDQEREIANYRAGEPGIGGMMPWHNLNDNYSESGMGFVGENTFNPSDLEPTYFGFVTDGSGTNFDRPNLISYMESHDEQWLMHKNAEFGKTADDESYDVQELETGLDRQKLVAAFFLTVPGPRMTWQFAELGYGYRDDECLREDDGSDSCGPGVTTRTGPKPVRWEYRDPQESPNRVRVYRTWKELLRLRNNHEVFSKPPSTSNDAEGIKMLAEDGDEVRCLRLEDETLDVTIVGNFGVTPLGATLGVANGAACSFTKTGTWYNFFEDKPREVNSDQTLQLRPGEFRIYTDRELTPPPMGLVPSAPISRTAKPVSSDGLVDFGATGVDVDFKGVNNSATVTVEKLNEDPLVRDGISEGTVSAFRYVIEDEADRSFGNQTEVRFDVSTLDGVNTPGNVTVYSRSTEDVGTFSKLNTEFDEAANELVVETGSFSEFVMASNTEPLPVELADFGAVLAGEEAVRLSWQTLSETNNAGFQVQRRRSRTTGWTDLGFVEGAGTTENPQSYRFEDALPFVADSVRYRLKQIDIDGTTELSDEVIVEIGAPEQLTLQTPFPNPARKQATIRYVVPSRQEVSLELFDVLGRRVRTLERGPREGRQARTMNVSGLSSGVYILRLQAGGTVETTRVTIVK